MKSCLSSIQHINTEVLFISDNKQNLNLPLFNISISQISIHFEIGSLGQRKEMNCTKQIIGILIFSVLCQFSQECLTSSSGTLNCCTIF